METRTEEKITVRSGSSWSHVVFQRCTIYTERRLRNVSFSCCEFKDCTYVYDGMEVSGDEWLRLVMGPPIIDIGLFDIGT